MIKNYAAKVSEATRDLV